MARQRSSNPVPLIAPIITGVTALVTVASSYFGEKRKAEAYEDAVTKEAVQRKKEEVERDIQLATLRRQANLDEAMALSTQRRQEQVLALTAVGAVAVGFAGLILVMALKGAKK